MLQNNRIDITTVLHNSLRFQIIAELFLSVSCLLKSNKHGHVKTLHIDMIDKVQTYRIPRLLDIQSNADPI